MITIDDCHAALSRRDRPGVIMIRICRLVVRTFDSQGMQNTMGAKKGEGPCDQGTENLVFGRGERI